MNQLLLSLARYWELRSRIEQLALPLDEEERGELGRLEALLQDASLGDVVAHGSLVCRDDGVLPARVERIDPLGFEVRAEGACALEVGAWTVLRLTDAATGADVMFPCGVTWHAGDTYGLHIDGLPVRTSVGPSLPSSHPPAYYPTLPVLE
jgi:hypothetical protein